MTMRLNSAARQKRKNRTLLCLGMLFFSASAQAVDYVPNIERREIVTPGIDTENLELTAMASFISVQDYNFEPHFSFRLAYHPHESFFIEGSAGQADIGISQVERAVDDGLISGASNLTLFEDRSYTDFHLSLGWVVLPGHTSFRGKTYIQQLYLIGGGGLTNFADSNNTTVNFGAGYRLLITDNLAIRAEARDYIVSWDDPPFGTSARQHNLSMGLGVSLFF